MAIFAVETDKEESADRFFVKSHENLQIPNLLKNPFNGWIVKIQEENKSLYLVNMEPIYAKYYLFGAVIAIGALIVARGFTWFIIPGVLLYSLGIFWSSAFFYLMLKVGLKKAGYKGKARHIRNIAALERIGNYIKEQKSKTSI